MISPGALVQRYRVAADPLRTERRVELAVVVLAALLALQVLVSLGRLAAGGNPRPVAPTADTLAVADPLQRDLTDAAGSEVIRARPLFWPERHPLAGAEQLAEQERASAKSGELRQIRLLGVFGAGERAGVIALVKQKERRVLVGDRVLGWQLTAVEGNRAHFQEDGDGEWLQLRISNAAPDDQEAEPAPAAKSAAPARGKKTAPKSAGRKPTGDGTAARRESPGVLTLGGRPAPAD